MTAYALSPGMTTAGLGTVTKEESIKDAGLFQSPMPGSDANEAILLDLFGASRTINISGVYVGSAADVATFVIALDALVSGDQVNQAYTSGKSGVTYSKCLVNSVTWTSEEGSPTKVDYTISLTEGGV